MQNLMNEILLANNMQYSLCSESFNSKCTQQMAVKGDTVNVFSACAGGFACRKHVTITFMSSHQSLQEFTVLNLQSMVMTKILFIFRTISASSSFHKETQEFCSKKSGRYM